MSKNTFIPNSFPIPNEFVDKYGIYLNDQEFRILIVMARHTIGWEDARKSWCRNVSLSRIKKVTGYDKKTILKYLARLCDYGFIRKVGGKNQNGQKFKLNRTCNMSALLENYKVRINVNKKSLIPKAGGGCRPPLEIQNQVVDAVHQGGGCRPPEVVDAIHQIKQDKAINNVNGNEKLNAIVNQIHKRIAASSDGFGILDEIATGKDDVAAMIAQVTSFVLSRFKDLGFEREVKNSWAFHLKTITKFVAADQIFALKRTLAEVLADRESLNNPGAVYNIKIQECAKNLGIDLELKRPNAKASVLSQTQERKVA